LYDALVSHIPDEKVQVRWKRGDQPGEAEVTLGKLPTDVPEELPPARQTDPSGDEVEMAVGEIEIKLPEFKNECLAYVPEDYTPEIAHGVVIWLPSPGGFDKDKLIARWKDHCSANDLILLVPQMRDAERWNPDEAEFVRRALDNLSEEYEVDAARTIVHGRQAGGAMAVLVFSGDEAKIHGVAIVDAAMPPRARPPALQPTSRAAVYWAFAKDGKTAERIKAQIEQLKKMNYPVTQRELDRSGRDLNDAELAELVRWIDCLDRI
jgi:serine protease Do